MNMSFFLQAFTAAQLEQMRDDPECINTLVDGQQAQAAIDLDDVGDALRVALNGVGFASDEMVGEVLSFGCMLVDPELVKVQAAMLARWDQPRLMARVEEMYNDEDAEEMPDVPVSGPALWPHFVTLQQFYQQAAQQGWVVLIYLA
ncbi:DUF1877 family protein [Chitinibacter sp. GC72]|uniref:DUF1877 family protein n=1 Tax=Chitinibacter sp. GC72 TaxID=1526917 RepID=UPI0012F97DBE|nr:DUF1877 family protein [Chitinibacter sp. GC72]